MATPRDATPEILTTAEVSGAERGAHELPEVEADDLPPFVDNKRDGEHLVVPGDCGRELPAVRRADGAHAPGVVEDHGLRV